MVRVRARLVLARTRKLRFEHRSGGDRWLLRLCTLEVVGLGAHYHGAKVEGLVSEKKIYVTVKGAILRVLRNYHESEASQALEPVLKMLLGLGRMRNGPDSS